MKEQLQSAAGFEVIGQKAPVMARRRFQQPEPYVRGKYWEVRIREDEVLPGGTIKRKQKRVRLGLVKELTKKLALRARDAALGDINSVTYRPRPASTFKDFAERWLTAVSITHKASSQYCEKSILRSRLIPRWGDLAMKDIESDPEAVQQWIASLNGLGAGTVINTASMGKRLFDCAKKWRYVTYNPFDDLVLPRMERKERFAFTQDQMRLIVLNAKEPFRTIFWICAETGVRVGEALAIEAGNINLAAHVLTVRQSVYMRKVQSTKSGKPREFVLSPLLTEHLRSRVENKSGLLFLTKKKAAYWDKNIRISVLRPLCKELGFELPKGTGFHAFRHGNASVLDRLNVPMRVRQDRLGHARQETTMRYTHALSDDHRNVATQLGAMFAPEVIQ